MRAAIVRAIPTCTLWRLDPESRMWIFWPAPRWRITHIAVVESAG